jgi:hypothetical protein
MKISKVDWKIFDQNFKDKFIQINKDVNLSDVLFNSENNSFVIKINDSYKPLGCIPCISGNHWQTEEGDIAIGDIVLLNYKNLSIDKNFKIGNAVAQDLANNIWICPNCNRWIFDYLPKYDTMQIIRS